MRSLSSALSTALGSPVQQPALLVEVAFSTTRRWCSFATTTWNSQTWTVEDVWVEDLQVAALQVQGTLVFGNSDDAAAALVLSEGVADRSIRLWGFDAAATATGDVVWLCDAVGAAVQIDPRQVRIALRHRAEMLLAPRTYITEAAFGTLLPEGTVLKINGRDFRMARRGAP
jgi:hypothetical protein